MGKKTTCCISGHRDLTPEQGAVAVLKTLGALLVAGTDGYTTYIMGMAKGVDQIAARNLLRIKKARPDFQLVAAIAHRGELENRDPEFQRILKGCDRVVVLSEHYHPGVFARRNEWMLEQSSRLIAAWDGRKTGGTVQTMREAERMGIEVQTLDLNNPEFEPFIN